MQDSNPATAIQSVPLADIKPSDTPAQNERRKAFDKAALAELAKSIETHGIVQPIILRPHPTGAAKFELVAGERRFLASDMAGVASVPAVVRDLTDEQVLEVQLIENLQRAELHPMHEAEGYQELVKTFGHSVDEIPAKIGKSRSYVYGRLKLLALTPKCRTAFYRGEISPSVALLLARIPGKDLQAKALNEVVSDRFGNGAMTYKRALEHIQRNFMLRLADAPFDVSDEKLIAKAPACGACPKRTGNQPELFGDVQSADVCTDPECFAKKIRAFGSKVVAAAAAEGRKVITGGEAKKIAPHGVGVGIQGFRRLDDRVWDLPGNKTVGHVVKDVEPVILQDPKTGAAVEVVPEAVARKAIAAAIPPSRRASSTAVSDNEKRKAAKLEQSTRRAIYAELRPKLADAEPALAEICVHLWRYIDHDHRTAICAAHGWDTKKLPYGSALEVELEGMPDGEVRLLMWDLMLERELQVRTYQSAAPDLLMAACAEFGIDAAAIRRRLAAEARAKATKKKPAKKKTAKAGGKK